MVRCARSSTSLVWGIPVHPTYLLRAVKTHERLTPVLRALRGCHLFAPDPPSTNLHSLSSLFTVTTPAPPFAAAAALAASSNATLAPSQPAEFTFIPAASPPFPLSFDASTSSTPSSKSFVPAGARTRAFTSRRKGIASLPAEILELIEMEVVLSAHEEDVPRRLVDSLESAGLYGEEEGGFPGWKRVCLCGERYVETGDVMRCRERVLMQVKSDETQKYLLQHFGLTTAIVSTPLKHAVVLLVLPHKVLTLPAQLLTMSSLPMHPPVSRQLLSTFPRETPSITARRRPASQMSLRQSSTLPPPAVPLVTPSDDFVGHLHPGMFARNHWRLRNQNSGIRASVVDPAYLLLTEEKLRRFRWCAEELMLWRGLRLGREELGYEELGTIGHFDMKLSGGGKQPASENSEMDGNWWCLTDRLEEDLVYKDRGKRPKVEEDNGAQEMEERERKYWEEAIKPELWLLEELAYEP